MRRARLERDPDGFRAALKRQTRTLHYVQELLGEAVTDQAFCKTVYQTACGLLDVQVIPELADQRGRVGRGLARVEHREPIELIFDALHRGVRSSSARRWPPADDIPAVTELPCQPPNAG